MATIENNINTVNQIKKVYRYRFCMHVVKLAINKNIQFCTKIVWKRNDKKTETKFSTHTNCESVFNESLQMDFDLIYNQQFSHFEPKETEIIVIVFYQGNIKSGGLVKFDVSSIINQNSEGYLSNLDEQINFSLMKCPDPAANLAVRLNYKMISSEEDTDFKKQQSQLTTDTQILSMIKFNSPRELPLTSNPLKAKSMSLVQKFEQKEQELQIRQEKKSFLRINSLNLNDKILNSSSSLSKIIYQQNSFCHRQNRQNMSQVQVHSPNKRETLPIETERLKRQLKQLSQKNEELHQTLIDLKIQHDKQNRAYDEIISQLREELQEKHDLLERSYYKLSQCKTQVSNGLNQISELDTISIFAYKDLYQKTLQELEQAKNQIQQMAATDSNNESRESFGFKNFSIMDNISQIHEVGQFQINNTKDYTMDEEIEIREERIQNLERQNTQLQVQIASISHKIGQIFNAAFQFGGARLLDHLQNSIGLTEDDER